MARTPPLGPAGRVPGRTDHVVVVGAGLSGLSAALHLVGAGRTVTVLERDPRPGGRAGQAEMAGYRVDTGASVLTMPDLIEETFAAVGESLSERLELIPVRPAYRAVFADDSTLDVHSDAEAMAAEIRSVIGAADAAGYLRLRHWLGELYRARRDAFLDANVDSPLDLLNPKLAALVALGGFGRLGPAVGRFVRDERLRRVFTFHSLCAGVSPESALAGYGAMPGMDMVRGVFFPRGGVGALAEAMAAAARDAGARLRFDTPVAWLERVGSRVSAVRTTAGERIPCDAVVLTPDLQAAYRLLGVHPRRLWPTRWAPSAFLLHAGGQLVALSAGIALVVVWRVVEQLVSPAARAGGGRAFGLDLLWSVFVQLYVTLLGSFAILLLGIVWPRANQWGGLAGLALGVPFCFVLNNTPGLFTSENPFLFVAWWSFIFSMIVTIVVSLLTPKDPEEKLRGLTWSSVVHSDEAQGALEERNS